MDASEDLRLLAYSVDVHRIRAIELTAGGREEHDLGPSVQLLDGFDALQRELNSPASLSRPRLAALERFAAEWGRGLLPETWLADPPRHGVLIPHALLHSVPLHLIRTDSGRPLCADTALSLCSSLTLLQRCLERTPRPGRHVDALMEDSTDTGECFAAGADVLGANDDAWRALPARLLAGCGAHVDQVMAVNRMVSFREIVGRMLAERAYELVIIAAHGFRDPLDALSSGLLLRENEFGFTERAVDGLGSTHDADGVPFRTEDLPVRELPARVVPTLAAELLALAELERTAHLRCPLVALLGCSTGRAVVYAGDQPVSLAEVFLRVGAAAVLAPMWDVTVSAVEAWMSAFLDAYRRGGASRGEAARLASRSRSDAHAPLHECGCLVLRGDYRKGSLT